MIDFKSFVSESNPYAANQGIRLANAKILSAMLEMLKGASKDKYGQMLSTAYYRWLPDYFFIKPASSSGKYHPDFANLENGLLLHSAAAVRYFDILAGAVSDNFRFLADGFENIEDEDLERFISSSNGDEFRNAAICAAFLHDMLKYGDPASVTDKSYTVHEHPDLAAGFFRDSGVRAALAGLDISSGAAEFMALLIETHMGKWTTNKYSPVILKAPATIGQRLLHTADYLTSRREGDIVSDLL